MKETHKYVGIGTVVGLFIGQLLVAVTHWNNKEYLGVLLVMFIGMVIGTIKDQTINDQLKKKSYTIIKIQLQEGTGRYEMSAKSKVGEVVTLTISSSKMEKEKYKVGEIIFLNKNCLRTLGITE